MLSGNLKKLQERIQLERVIVNQTLCDLVNTLKTGSNYLMYTQASEKTDTSLSGPQLTTYCSKMLQTLKIHGIS